MRSHGAFAPLAPISTNIVAASTTAQGARATLAKANAYDVENTMDGPIHDDLTSESRASNLTSLEDQTTDDFGKLLLQHARDEQRLHDALHGRARPFSRARPRQRGRLTLADLERSLVEKETSFEQRRRERDASFLSLASPPGSSAGSAAAESTSLSSSPRDADEPSLNVPREWGSKARKGAAWLRRSLDKDEERAERAGQGFNRRGAGLTGDGTPRAVDWAHAASDVPLPTTEDSPSALRYSRGTPPSAQTRERATGAAGAATAAVKKWDLDEEFTSTSIIASTPALPRNTRLDDIRRRELEPLAEVSGLDALEEQALEHASSPVQASVRRSAERKRHRPSQQQPSAPWKHPAEQALQRPKQEQVDRSPPLKKSWSPAVAALANPDRSSPVVVYKRGEAPQELRQRPDQHGRADSQDLLRRLARATSGSPSPGRAADTSSDKQTQAARAPRKDADELSKAKAQNEAPVDDPIDPVTPLPDELLGTGDGPLARDAKTPIVTGAWVDTPAPATARRMSLSPRKTRFSPQKSSRAPGHQAPQSPVKPSQQMHGLLSPRPSSSPTPETVLQKPSLPPSALAAVLDNAKSHPTTTAFNAPTSYEQELQNFGESTINSLEDLVDTSLAATSTDNTVTLDLPDLPAPGAKPRNAAERQRWKEVEQVARMNRQLKDARHSIRDARVGLRRFENAMLSNDAEGHAQHQQQQQRGNTDGCDSCGCPGGSLTASNRPIRSLGTALKHAIIVPQTTSPASPPPGKHIWPFRWRLTWLGLLIATVLGYTLLESALCASYCQPRYAATMHSFGVDPSAPRAPFVIPTLLLSRPLSPVLRPVYAALRNNCAAALRACGVLPDEAPGAGDEVFPWTRGRPARSPEERGKWDAVLESARRQAAPEVTRWAERVVTALEQSAGTAVRWAGAAAATAATDEEVLGMGADEVL